MREVSKNHTTLTIAHRLSTVIDADEIIVLENGRIIERGTHQSLLDLGGMYTDMWNRQQQAAEARKALEDTGELEEILVTKGAE